MNRIALLFLLVIGPSSFARDDIAIVWRGPGVCKPNCGPNATAVANQAGLRVISVHPGFHDWDLLENARVWIQPGGKSTTAAKAMGPELMEHLRQYIRNGGGYVGFCAGMFLSTEEIGTSGQPGLGILPGKTELFLKSDPPPTLVPVTIATGVRMMYYAGGPFLTLPSDAKGVEVLGRYADQSIASIRVPYGQGRVAVSGFHPEQSRIWKWYRGLHDPDGSDRDFAVNLIRYAAGMR